MGQTEMVHTANQGHARVEEASTCCRMPTFAPQASLTLPKRAMQACDESRMPFRSPTRKFKHVRGLLPHPVSHLTGNLHHALFLGALDHRPTVQV